MSSAEEIRDAVAAREGRVTVGISGFGGAGKTTLAVWLTEQLPDVVRVRGDDFLEPRRSHERSADWAGVERQRLRQEVLEPFRAGREVRFRPYDWSVGELGSPVVLPPGRVLVVDLIGLFHPEVLDALDLRVWVDVPLDVATRRGLERDARLRHLNEDVWRGVWLPNERDFAAAFDPRSAATHVLTPPEAPLTEVRD